VGNPEDCKGVGFAGMPGFVPSAEPVP
jgi:hypothetical protein